MRLIPFLLFFAITSCSSRKVVVVPLPSEDCIPACENLFDLGCEEAEDFQFCVEVCVNAQTNGFDMNLECALKSQSCDEFRICHEIDE